MCPFLETNNINLHYLEYGNPQNPSLILLHGLSANAESFGGLIKAGLAEKLHVLLVDLRGRGLSDKPSTGYSMANHACDIVGLLDGLNIEQATLGGHSFGGLLTIYMGSQYPDRVRKMIIIDAGIMHDKVREMVQPSLDRLGKVVPSWEAYIDSIRNSPYYQDGFWNEELEAYYRADVEFLPDGSVIPRSAPYAITEAADKVLSENWVQLMATATQPAILLQAPDSFGAAGLPILTDVNAVASAKLLANCQHLRMTGHHISMLFGDNAPGVVKAIEGFVLS
jgi:pimeloyl-ACP methyl ester carboxylesterase